MQEPWPEGSDKSASARDIYTVARLNGEARALLERGLGLVWLEGEVSNLARPTSGHWYFSLKDENAQVRCAMFRQRNRLVRFSVQEGAQVLAHARVSLYEPRGEFQLIIDHLEEAGEGLLRRRFENLKRQLAAEGLFDREHKRALPRMPRRIGVITSPTGAALRDILHVLARRFPAIPVLIYPVAVQGVAAAPEIVKALGLAAERAECDVLILARGGGSIEDLWAFNESAVARAIWNCRIPLICGVGHETDVTIADFVADERAPTPSGAAERVVPDREEWLRALLIAEQRIVAGMRRRLLDLGRALELQQAHLSRNHPGTRLRQYAQRLDESETRLMLATRRRLAEARARLEASQSLLLRASPAVRVAALRLRLESVSRALGAAVRGLIVDRRRRFELAASTLNAVSPLATLERGYAIVTDATGGVLHDPGQVRIGETIQARLARGRLTARVTASDPVVTADAPAIGSGPVAETGT